MVVKDPISGAVCLRDFPKLMGVDQMTHGRSFLRSSEILICRI